MRSWYWGSRVSRFWSSRLTARRLAAKRPRGAVPTRPCLLGSPPAVDGQNGSGDQTSGPRREEDNGGGDIGGRANAPDGYALQHGRQEGRIVEPLSSSGRVDPRRSNGVDRDAERRPFEGEDLRHEVHAALAGRVDGVAPDTHEACLRAHVDYAAIAALDHVPADGLAGEEQPLEIDRHHRAPT